MDFKLAIATSDEKELITDHFGEAEKYMIYELKDDKFIYLKTIKNESIEEEHDDDHGDPEKAKSVNQLLSPHGIKIVSSIYFGPNIKRMKKNFLPVKVRKITTIDQALDLLSQNLEVIKSEFNKGEKRTPLTLTKEE
ncbi:MAG: NifB/NifX family molybdenum-iron cluster-binding protein [Candidatus Kariarchaeaceae archaeon]